MLLSGQAVKLRDAGGAAGLLRPEILLRFLRRRTAHEGVIPMRGRFPGVFFEVSEGRGEESNYSRATTLPSEPKG